MNAKQAFVMSKSILEEENNLNNTENIEVNNFD